MALLSLSAGGFLIVIMYFSFAPRVLENGQTTESFETAEPSCYAGFNLIKISNSRGGKHHKYLNKFKIIETLPDIGCFPKTPNNKFLKKNKFFSTLSATERHLRNFKIWAIKYSWWRESPTNFYHYYKLDHVGSSPSAISTHKYFMDIYNILLKKYLKRRQPIQKKKNFSCRYYPGNLYNLLDNSEGEDNVINDIIYNNNEFNFCNCSFLDELPPVTQKKKN